MTKVLGQFIEPGSIDETRLSESAKAAIRAGHLVALRVKVSAFNFLLGNSVINVTAAVTAAQTTADQNTDLSAKGVYVGSVANAGDALRVIIRLSGTDNAWDDETGDDVYGVLAWTGSDYTLSLKKHDGTAYTPGVDTLIDFDFVEVFDGDTAPAEAYLETAAAAGGGIDAATFDLATQAEADAQDALAELGTLNPTPTNYTPTSADVGGHLAGLDTAVGAAQSDATAALTELGTLNPTPTNYAPTSSDVAGHLTGIDTALGVAQGSANSAQSAADAAQADATAALDELGTLPVSPTNYTPTSATVGGHLAGIDQAGGASNGFATLDPAGKLKTAQLPSSVVQFVGVWDASTNTPTLADGTGVVGAIYIVSTGGTQNLGSGNQTFVAGDWVAYEQSTQWKLIHAGADAVRQVNGFSGIVNLTTTDIPEGVNQYFLDARARAAAVEDAINAGTTDKAPSEAAVYYAIKDFDSRTNDNAGPITTGQLVYLKSSGNVDLARANAAATATAALGVVFDASIASGIAGNIVVKVGSRITVPGATFTPGQPVYMSVAAAGGYTQVEPTGTTDYIVQVGEALSATVYRFEPLRPRLAVPFIQEVPTGVVNGTNMDFVLSQTPKSAMKVMVFVDRFPLITSEFSVNVGTKTVTTTVAPQPGQDVYVSYWRE